VSTVAVIPTVFALQQSEVVYGILIALALALVLLVPYLIKEIRRGKGELGPLRRLGRQGVTLGPTTPTGAGDNIAGRRGDPAPGQPDAQDDPYSTRAQRNAPPIKS
jgi:hypothetical protein